MYQALRQYINEVTEAIIPDEEFDLFKAAFVPKSMKRKHFLLHEGSVCKYMAFIVKGALRQYRIDDKGTEHIVRFGTENWWMSDRQSFTMLTPSKYNIDALEDADLLITTNDKIVHLTVNSPAFLKMAHVLDERNYIATEERIHVTLSHTAEERFVYLMNTHPEFLQRFPQTMLASYLGITPETFSRVRKQVLAGKLRPASKED